MSKQKATPEPAKKTKKKWQDKILVSAKSDDQVAKPKHPGGRPTDYNPQLAAEICATIASNHKGLQTLCDDNPNWPNPRAIYMWMFKHTEFAQMYARAKRDQVTPLVDRMLDIVNDSSEDIVRDDKGRYVKNREWIERARLICDNYKWIACKLLPRLYGDQGAIEEVQQSTTSVVEIPSNGRIVKDKK